MIDNVSPKQTWEALKADGSAHLVDVRTEAEFTFVGLPDLSDAAKQPVLIPWQVYPTMQVNAGFVQQLRAAGLTPANEIYFLCRSGARSMAAAEAARSAGFAKVYNIADGFEGPPDGAGHRGTVAGWKADGLPWRQR
jgi:rhodanese-related sulfurtransferase